MGKEKPGFLTPKAISNRIKSKGLQKLKWYCQMCQKQCRDENGFKCHMTSESHQRQLLIFADNPNRFMDDFSSEFLKGYLDMLKSRFNTRRVHCNQVYLEYIKDKEHVHMNGTRWLSLTGFAFWLGKHGYAEVDDTEKGVFIKYIPRDSDTLLKKYMRDKNTHLDKTDEEREKEFLEAQIRRGAESSTSSTATTTAEATELKRDDENEKITFAVTTKTIKSEAIKEEKRDESTSGGPLPGSSKSVFKKEAGSTAAPLMKKPKLEKVVVPGLTVLEELKRENERIKGDRNRRDNWLCENIVVRCTNKSKPKLFMQKFIIKELKEKYVAIVAPVKGGDDDEIILNQRDVDTVVPALIGTTVRVVNGGYRKETAVIEAIDTEKKVANLRISKGLLRDRLIENVDFKDFSKLQCN